MIARDRNRSPRHSMGRGSLNNIKAKNKQAPTREAYGSGWSNGQMQEGWNGGNNFNQVLTTTPNSFLTSSSVVMDSFMNEDLELSLEAPRKMAEYKSMKDTALNIKGSDIPSRVAATYTSLKALKESAK